MPMHRGRQAKLAGQLARVFKLSGRGGWGAEKQRETRLLGRWGRECLLEIIQ